MLANNPELVISAVLALGEMKSVESVDDLIPLLTLRRYFPSEVVGGTIVCDHFVNFSSRFPAVGALISIGRPALPTLALAIGESKSDSLRSYLARYAVMAIFKGNEDAGVQYLRDWAAGAWSARAYERLSKAAQEAEKAVAAARH